MSYDDVLRQLTTAKGALQDGTFDEVDDALEGLSEAYETV